MGLKQQIRGSVINSYLGERMANLKRYGHRALGGSQRLELYYQADDPYSHLLVQVLPRLLEHHPLELSFFTVGPSAPEFDPQVDLRAPYALADAHTLSSAYGLSFPVRPTPRRSDQIRLANAIMLADREPPLQLRVAAEVGEALWLGDEKALTRAATSWGRIDETAIESSLEIGTTRLQRKGHYQGGMLRYLGEWFWGIDRLSFLEAQLKQGRPPLPSCLPKPAATATDTPTAHADTLEFFFSFRSPYSYLAIDRIAALAQKYALKLQIKPVLPMVMRGLTVPRAKRMYIVRDCRRLAASLNVPFGRICDPLGPGIERCLALFMHARENGRALPFIRSAGRGIWSEALDVADDHDLKRIVERAHLSWPEARQALNGLDGQAMAQAHRKQLTELGLWGVPSFRLGDFAIWGQDRIDELARRLAAASG